MSTGNVNAVRRKDFIRKVFLLLSKVLKTLSEEVSQCWLFPPFPVLPVQLVLLKAFQSLGFCLLEKTELLLSSDSEGVDSSGLKWCGVIDGSTGVL